ncbi:MAG: Uma2 family endonuclease [Pirellulaceae bacterium]|nr:Uma2 family endonuclease [Pirellulaceae bacterium]
MSTVKEKLNTLITAEEFLDWVALPANRGRSFELRAGEVIEMPPAGKFHGFVCGNVAGILRNFAIARKKGYVCTNDAGVIVGRNPDSVRGPDVTFYEDEETADDMQRQYASVPPVLAVEVVSPWDRINDVMHRVAQLLSRGVQTVWVVDPEARDVSICRAGAEPLLVSDSAPVTAGQALADFSCPANEFFALPGR